MTAAVEFRLGSGSQPAKRSAAPGGKREAKKIWEVVQLFADEASGTGVRRGMQEMAEEPQEELGLTGAVEGRLPEPEPAPFEVEEKLKRQPKAEETPVETAPQVDGRADLKAETEVQVAGRVFGIIHQAQRAASAEIWGEVPVYRLIRGALRGTAVLLDPKELEKLPEWERASVKTRASQELGRRAERAAAAKLTMDNNKWRLGTPPRFAETMAPDDFYEAVNSLARTLALVDTRDLPRLSPTVVKETIGMFGEHYIREETDGSTGSAQEPAANHVAETSAGEPSEPGVVVIALEEEPSARAKIVSDEAAATDRIGMAEPTESEEKPVGTGVAESKQTQVEKAKETDPNGLTDGEKAVIAANHPAGLLRDAVPIDILDLPGSGRISYIRDPVLGSMIKEMTGRVAQPGQVSQGLEGQQAVQSGVDESSEPLAPFSDTELLKGMRAIPVSGLRTWAKIHGKLVGGEKVTRAQWFDLYVSLQADRENLSRVGGLVESFDRKASNILAADVDQLPEEDKVIVKPWQDDLMKRTDDPETVGKSRQKQISEVVDGVKEDIAWFDAKLARLQELATSRLPQSFVRRTPQKFGDLRVNFAGELVGASFQSLMVPRRNRKGLEFTELGLNVRSLVEGVTFEELFGRFLQELNRQATDQALLEGRIMFREGKPETGERSISLDEGMKQLCAMYGCVFDREMFAREVEGLRGAQGENGLSLNLSQARSIADRMQKAQGGSLLEEDMKSFTHPGWARIFSFLGADLGARFLSIAPSASSFNSEPNGRQDQEDLDLLKAVVTGFPEGMATYEGLRHLVDLYLAKPEGRFRPNQDPQALLNRPFSQRAPEWRSAQTALPFIKPNFFMRQLPFAIAMLELVCPLIDTQERNLGSNFDLLGRKEKMLPPGNAVIVSTAGVGKTVNVEFLLDAAGILFIYVDGQGLGTAMYEAEAHADDFSKHIMDEAFRQAGGKIGYERLIEMIEKDLVCVFIDEADVFMNKRDDRSRHEVGGVNEKAVRSSILSMMTRDENRKLPFSYVDEQGVKQQRKLSLEKLSILMACTPEEWLDYVRAALSLPAGQPVPADAQMGAAALGPAFASRVKIIGHPPNYGSPTVTFADPKEQQISDELDAGAAQLLGKKLADTTSGELYVGQCYLWPGPRNPRDVIFGNPDTGEKGTIANRFEALLRGYGGNPARVEVLAEDGVDRLILREACKPEGESGVLTLRRFKTLPEDLANGLAELYKDQLREQAKSLALDGKTVRIRISPENVKRVLELQKKQVISVI